jgi:hypothetical protein
MALPTKKFSLSADLWAVAFSLFLALLVRTGVIKTVIW